MLDEAHKTLFYPADASKVELTALLTEAAVMGGRLAATEALGEAEAADVDTLEFPEAGGTVERELAIPFLPYMDEVRVNLAEFVLHGVGRELAIANYTVSESYGSDRGRVIALDAPAQLRKVEIRRASSFLTFPRPLRLVVRPATRANGGFSFGPPIFADPPFHLPGNLYAPVLGGMTVNYYADGRTLLVLPNVLGTAWLIQYAVGDEATALTAADVTFEVLKVTVTAAPINLSLVVPAAEGDIMLARFPNALLPSAGLQPVGFTPIAQKVLSDRLKASGSDQVTLPIPLRFAAESGGAVGIRSHTLTARYVVRPLGAGSQTLALRGDWTRLTLQAPARLRPESGTVRLVVTALGRALNEGSPLPQATRPSSGVLVTPEQWAASPMPFLPPAPATVGSIVPLASVRVYVQAWDEAEVVAGICADVGGAPGPVVTPPLVRKLGAMTSGWVEFELPAPLPIVAGLAPLWVLIRSTRGRLLWFGQGPGSVRVSLDRGGSWGTVDPVLSPPLAPLVQLFHVVADPQPLPAVSLYQGATLLAADLLAGANVSQTTPREFVVEDLALPPGLLDLLATTTGSASGAPASSGRLATTLHLLSRAALDVTVEEMTLAYSPYQ